MVKTLQGGRRRMETKERRILRKRDALTSESAFVSAQNPHDNGFTVRKTIVLSKSQAIRWNANEIRRELDMSSKNMTMSHKKCDDTVQKTIRLTKEQANKWNPDFVREILDGKSRKTMSLSSEKNDDDRYKKGFELFARAFNSEAKSNPNFKSRLRKRFLTDEYELIKELIEKLLKEAHDDERI